MFEWSKILMYLLYFLSEECRLNYRQGEQVAHDLREGAMGTIYWCMVWTHHPGQLGVYLSVISPSTFF